MLKPKNFVPLIGAMLLLLSTLLAACGEAATATPVASSAQTVQASVTAPASIPTAAFNSGSPAATTSAAATTQVATTVAATTSAATTAAGATTAATTTTAVAATTAATTTTAAAGDTGTPKKGGSVTIGSTLEAKTLHLYNCVDVYCSAYNTRIFNATFTKRDPKTLQVVGNAATSWTVDKDAKTVTYKLKDGIKWSDGQAITSDDYLWTYQQAIKKENKWPRYSQNIADPTKPDSNGALDLTAPDPKTVVVKMNTLTFDIVERADFINPLPRHIWESKDWLDPTKNSEIDAPTVVNGPWLLKKWDKGKSITFVPNTASTIWPVPYLDSVTVAIVENTSIGFQKLKSGELDVFTPSNQDEAEAETLPNSTIVKWNPANASWGHISFNFRRAYFKDVKFRTALNYVVDRKAVIDKVYYGLAVPMWADVAPASDKYDDTAVMKYPYDPDKAKQILKDAGYTVKDGKLYSPDGTALPKLKYAFITDTPEGAKLAAIAQQGFKELGIDIDLVGTDFQTLLKTIQTEPFDYDFAALGWSAGINPEGFGDVWRSIPSLNFGAWVNDDVNKLYTSTLQEFDNAKRKQIMSQIQSIESRDGPYIYVNSNLAFAAVSKKLGGVTATPLGIGTDSRGGDDFLTTWYIK